MKTAEHAICARCGKTKRGVCFPIPVSKLERALGQEAHKCDKCGAVFKTTPKPEAA
jgi:hypothetical protein